jgi:hypothetical protein
MLAGSRIGRGGPDPQRLKRLRPGAVWWPAWLIAAVAGAALWGSWTRQPVEPVPPETARLDANRATVRELSAEPGLGRTLAQRIAAARARRGGFTAWEEIQSVPGLGPAKRRRLHAAWTLNGQDDSGTGQ